MFWMRNKKIIFWYSLLTKVLSICSLGQVNFLWNSHLLVPVQVSNHLSLYRSASRRLKSTSDEKQYDIPTTDQMRGKADPLHDTLQRTGDTFQATAVTMLSQEETNIYILKYGLTGFKLQSGIRVIGPIAVFPRSMFHWNVRQPSS